MKTTLRDFPTKPYVHDYQVWKANFEKELRDSLNWLQTMWHPRNEVQKAKRDAYIDEIKAVLGEE